MISKFDSSKLHVISVISNPMRYESRYRLYKQFEKHMFDSGANLWTVEAAFGDRSHEITHDKNPQHLQLRTYDILWQKENLINVGISRLPQDWEYVAWIDADIMFSRHDWINETIHQLQIYPTVQMFSTAVDLGPTGAVMKTYNGFAYSLAKGMPFGPGSGGSYGAYWHSGYAWAMRREAYEAVGGLIDFAIVGAGDHHMANSLIGRAFASLPNNINKNYVDMVYEWQDRVKHNHMLNHLGYVPGSIMHHYHGPKVARGYQSRWGILQKYDFNPIVDINKDYQGIIKLTKPGLRMRTDLIKYFSARNEDDIRED